MLFVLLLNSVQSLTVLTFCAQWMALAALLVFGWQKLIHSSWTFWSHFYIRCWERIFCQCRHSLLLVLYSGVSTCLSGLFCILPFWELQNQLGKCFRLQLVIISFIIKPSHHGYLLNVHFDNNGREYNSELKPVNMFMYTRIVVTCIISRDWLLCWELIDQIIQTIETMVRNWTLGR